MRRRSRASGSLAPMSDEGSTLIEAVVAVMVIAIAGAALFGGVGVGMRAFEKGDRAAHSAAEALMIDDTLRERSREVKIPYWERGARLGRDAGSTTVFYYGGLKKSTLSIAEQDSALVLDCPAGRSAFPGIHLISVLPLESGGALAGLDVSYAIGGRRYHSLAAFGAAPLAPTGGSGSGG